MDILLGLAASAFIFLLLLFAAIRDYQKREVSNWVWLIGLCSLPLTIFRIGIAGLWLVYGLQVLIVFFLVIIGFRVGVLGGADGKAVIIISLIYPWILLNPIWVLIASVSVLLGGFLFVGIHSLWLMTQNISAWMHVGKDQKITQKPKKKMYWLTRRFFAQETRNDQWIQVEVPLIIYFFISYIVLQILTSLLL